MKFNSGSEKCFSNQSDFFRIISVGSRRCELVLIAKILTVLNRRHKRSDFIEHLLKVHNCIIVLFIEVPRVLV